MEPSSSPNFPLCILEWVYVRNSAESVLPLLCLSSAIGSAAYFAGLGVVYDTCKVRFAADGSLVADLAETVSFVIQRAGYGPTNSPHTAGMVWHRNVQGIIFDEQDQPNITITDQEPVQRIEKVFPHLPYFIYEWQSDFYFTVHDASSNSMRWLRKLQYVSISLASVALRAGDSVKFLPIYTVYQKHPQEQALPGYFLLLLVKHSDGSQDLYDFTGWFDALFQDAYKIEYDNGTEVVMGSKLRRNEHDPEYYYEERKVAITIALASIQLASAIHYRVGSHDLQDIPRSAVQLEDATMTAHWTTYLALPPQSLNNLIFYSDILVEGGHYAGASSEKGHVFLVSEMFQSLPIPARVLEPSGKHVNRIAYARHVFHDMVIAVTAMHQAGFVHGQIGHECVKMLSKVYVFVLSDFSHAMQDPREGTLDMTKSFARFADGKALVSVRNNVPDYFCPLVIQAILSHEAVNYHYTFEMAKRYDIWCLGLILFYLLTLHSPAVLFENYIGGKKIVGALVVPFGNEDHKFVLNWLPHLDQILEIYQASEFEPDLYCRGFDLVKRILVADPAQHLTLEDIKQHMWLRQYPRYNYPFPFDRDVLFSPISPEVDYVSGKRTRET